jgi:hypothetical protein
VHVHPATNGEATRKKPPRVLRWIVLCLLFWIATAVFFFVSAEVTIASRLLGSDQVAVEPTARVELEQGQLFGFAADRDEFVTCEVIPEAGEARSFVADRPTASRRSARLPAAEQAWFTGPAEVRCTASASFIPPERYEKTSVKVLTGLMAASSFLILVVIVQIARRVRFNNKLYARG